MNQDKRLDKVTKSLTPKQAVVLWLQEIQDYRNATEFVHFLRSQPESAAPITRLTKQIDEAVREAMKAQPKEVVQTAVRRAVKDVVFLVKLHLQVNFKITSELRQWRLSQIALAESLRGMHTELFLRNLIVDLADQVNFQTPYPLEPDTAAAVDVAIRNHVHTFEAIIEEGHICDWLWDYLIKQGAKELPLSASEYVDGKRQPHVTQENEAEIRTCFEDEAQFELFRAGQDYTCDLASVTDAEYNAHYDTIVNAIRELLKSGQVQEGVMVRLETVPMPFLRDAPLIKGQWLDRHLVTLAEWGALLQSTGHHIQETEEAHLLESRHFIRGDGVKADLGEMKTLRGKVDRALAKFPGRILRIDKRVFIQFEDYLHWRGRKLKGDLRPCVKNGLVTASWNKWVSDHGGEDVAVVAGVPVGDLRCYVSEHSYSCPSKIEEQIRQREQLLESFRSWENKPDRKEELIRDWKYVVDTCLAELYAFRQAVAFIQKSYFDGQPVLFPDVADDLAKIITDAENTVGSFNDDLAAGMGLSEKVDLEALHQKATKRANQLIAYIVDMAKAEALDCLGDQKAAVELAERYL